MSALFKKKKSCVLVFFLLLIADRFSVSTQPFSDASAVAFDDSPFATNVNQIPDGLRNTGSIGFTEDGNLTLTLHEYDVEPVCIPLVALDGSSNFSFRASLGNCTIDKGKEIKWDLSYLVKKVEKGKLSIIWTPDVFKLVDKDDNEAKVVADPKDKAEVDVIFAKSQAFVTEKNVEVTNRTRSLSKIVPVDMQAMANNKFGLSISRQGSYKNCSITLEFDKKKFGLPKLVVTTTMSTTPIIDESTIATMPPTTNESMIATATSPEFDESTMSTGAPPGGKNSLWYIIVGVVLLIVCLIGIGIGVYFFIKRRRDKSKDPEKNSAPSVDDSKPAVGVSSFSTTKTTIKTPDTPSVDSKVDRVPEMKFSDNKSKEPEVKGAKIVNDVDVDKKSKKEDKATSKKVLVKEDKKKSSSPAKAEGKPGPKGKKVYVPLIDMENSLKSKSKQKTPGTDYENYK